MNGEIVQRSPERQRRVEPQPQRHQDRPRYNDRTRYVRRRENTQWRTNLWQGEGCVVHTLWKYFVTCTILVLPFETFDIFLVGGNSNNCSWTSMAVSDGHLVVIMFSINIIFYSFHVIFSPTYSCHGWFGSDVFHIWFLSSGQGEEKSKIVFSEHDVGLSDIENRLPGHCFWYCERCWIQIVCGKRLTADTQNLTLFSASGKTTKKNVMKPNEVGNRKTKRKPYG